MEWEGGFDPMSDSEEQRHILSVLESFRSYRRLAHFNGTHVRRQAFYSLPSQHWNLLSRPPFSVLDSLSKLDDLIDANAELAEAIFVVGFEAFIAGSLDSELVAKVVPQKYAHDKFQMYSMIMNHLNVKGTARDLDKARSCVNQFYRDWSAEGDVERTRCFTPVLATLNTEFESRQCSDGGFSGTNVKILVPGAGLGRLVFDICCAGYSVEGNEISYHELMASSLILNHIDRPEQFTIAPWALNGSNHLCRADQFRTYAIPDVHPASELSKRSTKDTNAPSDRMSMATGDFCIVYNQPDSFETFDAVVTVFFIDTAPNITRYIETVRNCLKGGGLWINLGPLLWHHASKPAKSDSDDPSDTYEQSGSQHGVDTGIADPGSVELTDEEVVALVQHLGFSIESYQPASVETGYITNTKSMLQSSYRASFWVARKQ